jgi:hypothetical protein
MTKYGNLTLEQAEAEMEQESRAIQVQKLVLIGASNGGSLRVLRELNRGRKYVAWIGRTWAPETLYTFVSLYQDLPAYTDDLLVDEKGARVAADLYDLASWQRYGWSIYGEESARRLAAGRHPELFGDAQVRERFLARALDRARRLQRLLRRDVRRFEPRRVYLIKNSHNETASRAVLVRSHDRWMTLFTGDPELERDPALRSKVTVAGDGHATVESQMWLSPLELERLAWDPVDIEGEHFEVILNPETEKHLLEILADG